MSPKKIAPVKKAASPKKPAAAKKAASSKKPAAAKKQPTAKKPAVKKQEPAKKPAAKKPATTKKAEAAKKPAAVKSPEAVKKPTTTKKAEAAKKPATTRKASNQKLPPSPEIEVKEETEGRKATARKPRSSQKSEVAQFENKERDLAFMFAEHKKMQALQDEQRLASEEVVVRLSRRPTSRSRGEDTLQFAKSDLEDFRKRLILLRQEALGQSATLRHVALEKTDERGGEEEDGSDAFMRLQNLNQVNTQNRIIQKIDEALHRIADGTYGICEMCGQLIRKPRLMNLPFVHTCMECQNKMENPYRQG